MKQLSAKSAHSTGELSVLIAGRQRGFTLVELMVALVISSFIMIAILQIFSASRGTYQVDEGLARLQENGRFAIDFIGREIRQGGNMGCLARTNSALTQADFSIHNYLNSTSSAFNFSSVHSAGSGYTSGTTYSPLPAIQGFEYVGTAPTSPLYNLPTPVAPFTSTITNWVAPYTLDTTLIGGALAGSDILVLRHFETTPYRLIAPYDDFTKLYVAQPNDIAAGNILMVADCESASIFQVTKTTPIGAVSTIIEHVGLSTPPNPGNICTTWALTGTPPYCLEKPNNGKGYSVSGPTAEISRFQTVVLSICANQGNASNNTPSLCRTTYDVSGGATTVELVEGVENMQLLYGLDSAPNPATDTSGAKNADIYLTADKVTDWSQVVSVRVALLMRTVTTTGQADTSGLDTGTYTLNDLNVTPTPGDNQRRRVFTTTIRARNLSN